MGDVVTTPTITRATWTGTVTFGLVNVNVKLYSATQDNDVSFKQVHVHEGDERPGLIKYKRVCSGCRDHEVAFEHIDKGYDTGDGIVVLSKQDIAAIPLDTLRSIAVSEFVPVGSVDPILHERTYYLAPDGATSAKAYALLRDALVSTQKAGIVKVALRQREQVAVLHVRDGGFGDPVLALTTLRWADEVRHAALPILADLPASTETELSMAAMLVDSLSVDTFDPTAYTDGYRAALEALVASKRAGTPLTLVPTVKPSAADLMATVLASIETAKANRAAA